MFTNATLFTLYAQARRDEDLLPRRAKPSRGLTDGLGSRLVRLFRRPAASPVTPAATAPAAPPQQLRPARG